MAAEGGLEDKTQTDRPEEEETFGVEPAFTHNEKDFSPITYKMQHVLVQIQVRS